VIALCGVTKTYPLNKGSRVVLDDVSVTIPTDQSLGVLGRNGQGKSTLLRLIAGIEATSRGKVIRDVRVSWPIGFAGGFHGQLTGEENLRFICRIYGADYRRVRQEVRDFSELGDYFWMPLRTYSAGMRGRLAFALSMAIDFEVYLIDEVTAVGDKPFREKCQLALEERRLRSSVIMVSHNMETIRQNCRRCGVLEDGRLQLFDTIDEASAVYDEILAGGPQHSLVTA
jgi:capsular polysaccharide transport system ATP-binding protein